MANLYTDNAATTAPQQRRAEEGPARIFPAAARDFFPRPARPAGRNVYIFHRQPSRGASARGRRPARRQATRTERERGQRRRQQQRKRRERRTSRPPRLRGRPPRVPRRPKPHFVPRSASRGAGEGAPWSCRSQKKRIRTFTSTFVASNARGAPRFLVRISARGMIRLAGGAAARPCLGEGERRTGGRGVGGRWRWGIQGPGTAESLRSSTHRNYNSGNFPASARFPPSAEAEP